MWTFLKKELISEHAKERKNFRAQERFQAKSAQIKEPHRPQDTTQTISTSRYYIKPVEILK